MTTPSYDDFTARFDLADNIIGVEPVDAVAVPEPYRGLLVHTSHMTVTVERFFGDRVDVAVSESAQDGPHYARKILLSLAKSGRVVQFGVVLIELADLSPAVSEAILSQRTPLGRVLIDHGVFTTVEPIAYLKVALGPRLCADFGCPFPATTYGRIGAITANGHAAIEVLEIVTPTSSTN